MPELSLLKSFVTLIILVGVLGLALMLLKKYVKKHRSKTPEGDQLQILARTALQPKTNIYILKVGDRKLLVGTTDNNIATLADLTEESHVAADKNLSNGKNNVYNKKQTLKTLKQMDALASNPPADDLSFRSFIKSAFKRSAN